MCGIVGIVNFDGRPASAETLLAMRDAIAHRGPDDAGQWLGDGVGLGHRRLSIFDLSPLGHQPMPSADGEAWLVFNGEIFNFLEIRQRLAAKGHRFRSESDTEVLLAAWRERGEACLHELMGMYGFAIWDQRTKTLFAARDRAGIKPFYYAEVPDGLIFASEIKALFQHPQLRARLDSRGLADYLYAGYALGERTLFAGVRQLPPGHSLTVAGGRAEVRPYWSIEYRYDRARDEAATVAGLTGLLESSAEMHCRSDAPLGSHLSGGIDSSSVATMARRYRDPLDTFSIRFAAAGPFDETRYARAVASTIGSRYHEETPPESELESILPLLIYQMDFPMRAGGYAYFCGARLARRHVTVSLTGHGGDEVFGGYPAQFEVAFGAGGIPSSVASRESVGDRVRRLATVAAEEGARGLLRRVRRRAERTLAEARDPVAERWIARHCSLPEPALRTDLSESFRRSLGGYSPRADYLRDFSDAPTDDLFDRCLHHDLRTYLPSLLHVEDRASMVVSLESRVPLLDHRLIEYLATVPGSEKVPSRESKELLRKAMAGRLPAEVTARRDKGAFPVPTSRWMGSTLRRFVEGIVRDPRTLERGLFDPDWLRRAPGRAGGEELWTAMSVELWARLFLDNDAALLQQVTETRARLRRSLGFPR